MSRARSVMGLFGLGMGLAMLLTTDLASAQQAAAEPPAKLQGVVVRESTFEAIEGALVEVVGTDFQTRTGPLGQFSLPEAPLGTAWVRVTVEGLPSVREQVEIKEQGVVFLQFRMPEDVFALLDEIQVDVRPTGQTGSATNALQMLAQKVPSVASHASGDLGDYDVAIRLRGFNSFINGGDPIIVIDGARVQGPTAFETLSRIPASDVESIEVLRGPAAAFRYPFAADGVILVNTRKN
jgi:outer membrane receptor protein involved in Fe transport